MTGLSFLVLGPLEVRDGTRRVPLSAPKQRVILAVLLLEAGRSVSVEHLADHLWGDEPVRNAKRAIQTYVMRLRDLLGDDAIRTSDDGYRMGLEPERLDLARFDAALATAAAALGRGDDETAVVSLTEALALWRGPALGNVPSERLQHAIAGLEERRLSAVEQRGELLIRLGRADDVISELRALTASHPLRERVWGLLMRALYVTGRQGEALEAYRSVTALLADELGIDPSAELRDLHQAILTETLDVPDSLASPAPARTETPVAAVPRQLPAIQAGFVGRDDEIARIQTWLGETGRPAVVSGPPGVGKSALAVTVGHRLAERYPDGQLFVDLRGFSAERPLRASDVLPRFLRALGVTGDRIPADEDEQAAAYRSLVADKRVLVVLDNAATPDQVRPLLPGGPGCGVVVTSRNQLHPLVVIDGARTLPLEALRLDDATAVLTAQTEPGRVAADPDAAARIAELCGRLPLALRVAGAYLALRPDRTVADYAADLDRGGRLIGLWVSDEYSVTAAFELSYAALDADAQRLFRRLGLIPGPDFTAEAVEALTGEPDVRRRLDSLVSASLVLTHGPARFRMHDLVRDYARMRAADDGESTATGEARQRLFDWYIRKVDAAMLPETAKTYRLPRPLPDAELVRQTDVQWIDDELANLTAAVAYCAEHGPHRVVWHLADALRHYAIASGHETEFAAAAAAARDLAERDGDLRVVAAMLLGLGRLRGDLARPEAHLEELRQAATLFAEVGDRHGEATTCQHLCTVYANASRHDDALDAGARARMLFESVGDGRGVFAMTTNLALLKAERGDLTDAVADLETRENGSVDPESAARDHTILGYALRRVGRLAEAADRLERGIEILDRIEQRAGATVCRCDLARCLCDAGDYDRARPIVNAARAVAERDGHRENLLEARAVIAELDVRSLPPTQWDRGIVPAAAELESIADHPLYFRWLDILSWAQVYLGDHEKAAEIATTCLNKARERSLRLAEDSALTVLTAAQVGLAKYDQAIETGEAALRRHRETGYRLREARTLCFLGDARHAAGDTATAREHWQHAHDIYAAIGTAEVTEVERRLRA